MKRITIPLAALALTLAACGDDTSEPAATKPAGGSSAALPPGCPATDGSAPTKQQFDSEPPMCLADGETYTAVITTNKGTIHVKFNQDLAPKTVNSFVYLARQHYFDGTTCHRAIQGFVVQCGDPTATGAGGPGYEFADELSPPPTYKIGSVAMANSGSNTNGSQFFLITGPDGAALEPNYTLFGEVDPADMKVLEDMNAVANPQDGAPLEPIDIQTVTIEVS
jgi:cyclophilin family peptidyl-prolyl cis-trans isomerase